jgi:hypothetical protein
MQDAGFDVRFRDCPAKGGMGGHPKRDRQIDMDGPIRCSLLTVGREEPLIIRDKDSHLELNFLRPH